MAAWEVPIHTTCDRPGSRSDDHAGSAHERRMKRFRIASPSSRMQSRDAGERRFFLVEGRSPGAVRISPGACLPRALLPARPSPQPPTPQVTGVLSDQFVLGGEVDFPPSSETANVNGAPGAAISGLPSGQFDKLGHEVAIRDDQSLVCPKRVLGRVLELVLRRSLLRFPPSGRGRKHGMAV
jgi:hypothetical protein